MSDEDEGRQERHAEEPEPATKKPSYGTLWRRANADRINARRRERHANDPAYREKQRARLRGRYASDPEYRERERARRRVYDHTRILQKHGLSREDFEAMLAQQQGACAICRRPFDRTPCIDHCPLTGWVRALLCSRVIAASGITPITPHFSPRHPSICSTGSST